MIKRIMTENFRGWNLDIELSTGVNIFRGVTSAGKSRILKAISTALTNSPQGSSILTRSKKTGTVLIVLEDFNGNSIEFKRKISKSTSKTTYTINGEEKKAVGKNVPKEVSEIFDIPEWITFANQHEREFIITEKPTDISRKIGDLTGLSIGEDILKDSRSKLHGYRSQKAQVEIQIRKAEEDIKQYKDVEKIGKLIKLTKIYQKTNRKQKDSLEKIQKTKIAIEERRKRIEKKNKQIGILKTDEIELDINEIEKKNKTLGIAKKYKGIKDKLSKLNLAHNAIDIEEIEENIIDRTNENEILLTAKKYKIIGDKLSRFYFIYDTIETEEIEKTIEKMIIKSSRLKNIKAVLSTIIEIEKRIKSNGIKLKKVEGQLSEYSMCPLCGGKL